MSGLAISAACLLAGLGQLLLRRHRLLPAGGKRVLGCHTFRLDAIQPLLQLRQLGCLRRRGALCLLELSLHVATAKGTSAARPAPDVILLS
jgi:hypothetical protein